MLFMFIDRTVSTALKIDVKPAIKHLLPIHSKEDCGHIRLVCLSTGTFLVYSIPPLMLSKEGSIATNPNIYPQNSPSRHLTMVPPA